MGTLRGRLAFFYAVVIALSLAVFAATMYGIVVSVESADPDPSGEEQRELTQIRRRVLLALAIAVPLGLVVAVGGGAFITRKAFVSLEEVVRTAATLDADNIRARIPSFAGAGAEVEQLAAALNDMLERLERAVLGLRRFTANAAHELRTPLTVMLGNVELSLRRPHDGATLRTTLEETFEELERMAQLVEALLTLARSDARELPVHAVSLDAVELVTLVVGLYETVATERGLTLSLSLGSSPPLPLHTDPLWLNRVVVNLLDNACKFTPAGGRVEVGLGATADGVKLTVQDTGPGIAAADRPQIFERFFRGAAMQSGCPGFGLGLALAQDLTRALGGTLEFEARADDQSGAQFVLQVPNQPR
jgi:two-component system OmpR family sensor kinase